MRDEATNSIIAIIVVGATILTVGDSLLNFVLASTTVLALFWAPTLKTAFACDCAIATVDPQKPDAAQLRNHLLKAFSVCEKKCRPMLLRIQTPSESKYVKYSLSLRHDGEASIAMAGKHNLAVPTGGKWIADHPTPMTIGNTTATELWLAPDKSGRIRVSIQSSGKRKPQMLCLLLGLCVLAVLLELSPLQPVAAAAFICTFLTQRSV